MPRLITDTVSIAARITHPETEVRCMTAQPSECRRIVKTLQCGRFSRCPDVDGAPAVVFTESWGCVHCKNVIEWNFAHFLCKLHDSLHFMKTQPPNPRVVRTFTLMPLKNGFVMSHITICSSCLQQILQSIVKANQGISFSGHANIVKQVFDANEDTF